MMSMSWRPRRDHAPPLTVGGRVRPYIEPSLVVRRARAGNGISCDTLDTRVANEREAILQSIAAVESRLGFLDLHRLESEVSMEREIDDCFVVDLPLDDIDAVVGHHDESADRIRIRGK